MKYRYTAFLLTSLTLALAGCGGEAWQAETHPASGRVSVNGEPPVGALVHLYPAAESVDKRNSRPWGKVQEDGTFTLSTYKPADGAPVGEYIFTIVWPDEPLKPTLFDRLGHKYAKPEQSQWRLVVEEGENEFPPIEMQRVKVTMEPPKNASPKHTPFDAVGQN